MSSTQLSLCIPSSTISAKACRSIQQATNAAYQIARTAASFNISEIVIYDVSDDEVDKESLESGNETLQASKKKTFAEEPENEPANADENLTPQFTSETLLLATLLQFFITPSYLRASIFTELKTLQYAKKLPKLPGLPILSHGGKSRYLEGLAVPQAHDKKKKKGAKGKNLTQYINIGEKEYFKLADQKVPINTRVTVDIEEAKVVSPKQAYGRQFGYTVRAASTLGQVFTDSTVKGGYSYTYYVPSQYYLPSKNENEHSQSYDSLKIQRLPSNGHGLLIFGKWKLVEKSAKKDKALKDIENVASLFDGRLVSAPVNRVEDAVLGSCYILCL